MDNDIRLFAGLNIEGSLAILDLLCNLNIHVDSWLQENLCNDDYTISINSLLFDHWSK